MSNVDSVLNLSKDIAIELDTFIREKYKGKPAISILHALAGLYIQHYNYIKWNGGEDDVEQAKLSLKVIAEMVQDEDEESL